MTELDFESSQLQLLTDALRAGPGTPEWRAALDSISSGGGGGGGGGGAGAGGAGGDEYKLLYTARERLASGRQYREVRAGPGFTRRVFDAIERNEGGEGSMPRSLPAANLIAAVSALVILGVLALVVWLIVPGNDAQEAANDLSRTYFVSRIAGANFDSGLEADWTTFGKLAVEAKGGLRAVAGDVAAAGASGFVGGGVMYRRALPAEQPFAVEASLKLAKLTEDVAIQVFVTDAASFDGDSATTPHELVWYLRGNDPSVVLPDGTITSMGSATSASPAAGRVRDGQRIDVRIALNRADAGVEMNGRRLWSGRNQLDPIKARTVGVRFLAKGKLAGKELPVVESIRILVPQKQ